MTETTPEFVFPQDHENGTIKDKFQREGGLELRDYFAARALSMLNWNPTGDLSSNTRSVAKIAYAIADEMMGVRNGR